MLKHEAHVGFAAVGLLDGERVGLLRLVRSVGQHVADGEDVAGDDKLGEDRPEGLADLVAVAHVADGGVTVEVDEDSVHLAVAGPVTTRSETPLK